MKKRNALFSILIYIAVLAGCGNNQEITEQSSNAVETEVETNEKEDTSSQTMEEEKTENIFAEFKNLNFSFLSGAGGWSTEMTIAEDGAFEGVYHDSEMGSATESYPNGTYYYCSFRGKFSEPVKKEEHIYATTIENLSYDYEPGTEEIKDGIRYIYSEAYGLDDPKEILIYLPGMPIEELPEGYLSWVASNWRMDYEFTLHESELPFYGLYNVNAKQGFSSYDIIADLKQTIVYRKDAAAALEDSIVNDPFLTQADLNEKSGQMYEIWDLTLNEIWNVLKRNLNAEEMKALTEEQLEWIAMKEQSMKEAGAEVEGGSMYGMIVSQRGATLTKERVYELMELVNEISE